MNAPDGPGTVRCVSPIDGSLYAERPLHSFASVAQAIDSARDAQRDWAARPLAERAKIVMAGVERIGAANEQVVTELAWQIGRPVRFGGEYKGFHERAAYMASIADQALAPIQVEDSQSRSRYIRRIPQGVVMIIAPWNYPYMTAINTLAPALIAGNAVILKHAAQTLLVGERLEAAFREAGVPEPILHNIFVSHEVTAQVLAGNLVDFVNFTGSVGGGVEIEKAAAGTFTGVALELGGKDPAYVMDDADIEGTAAALIDGAMFNSGQCCCGIERIYVAESSYDQFVAKAVALASDYKLGSPLEPDTTLGPMAHQRFADEVRKQVDEAVAAGATALIDPKLYPEDDGGAYLMPQVLVDVDHSMRVMVDENFGPAVGIMRVSDDAEALRLMNDSKFGLTASVWTQDVERATAIADQLETGTVFMNRCDYVDPALCWSGCKLTGRGGGMSQIGYHSVTRPRSYHLNKAGSGA